MGYVRDAQTHLHGPPKRSPMASHSPVRTHTFTHQREEEEGSPRPDVPCSTSGRTRSGCHSACAASKRERGPTFMALPGRREEPGKSRYPWQTGTLRHAEDARLSTQVPNVEPSSRFPPTFSDSKYSRCWPPPLFTCRGSGECHCVVFYGICRGVKGGADPAARRPNFLARRRPFFSSRPSLVRCYCTLKCFFGPLTG